MCVTGTIGSGKSTVAALMSELLHEAGTRHALIEVDSLGEVYPAPDPDDPYSEKLAMEMLAMMWPRYLDAGITRAIVTMTIENESEGDELVRALGSAPTTIVRLDASEASRVARIERREFGQLRDPFIAKTSELAARMDRMGLGDIVVSNDDRDPVDTAREVLQRLGWM